MHFDISNALHSKCLISDDDILDPNIGSFLENLSKTLSFNPKIDFYRLNRSCCLYKMTTKEGFNLTYNSEFHSLILENNKVYIKGE